MANSVAQGMPGGEGGRHPRRMYFPERPPGARLFKRPEFLAHLQSAHGGRVRTTPFAKRSRSRVIASAAVHLAEDGAAASRTRNKLGAITPHVPAPPLLNRLGSAEFHDQSFGAVRRRLSPVGAYSSERRKPPARPGHPSRQYCTSRWSEKPF